jgi:hypothetical protein
VRGSSSVLVFEGGEMGYRGFLYALLGFLAVGLIAAGCGDDDDDGDTTPVPGTTGEVGATGGGGALEDDAGADIEVAEDASPGAVYEQCLDAIEGLYNSDFPCRQVQRNYEQCEGEEGCAEFAADTIANLVRAG